MKVAIYSRKSRVTGKGESIKNQVEMCKEYIEKHFDVDEFIVYEDEGYSGGNSDRPKYKKMLMDAKDKKFSILICYRLDRISRNISDFSETIEMLKSLDISFISLREQFDTSTPMGRAMMYIASVFAQLERETIAERIKDNMLSLARTGRWLGGNPPTGYTSKSIRYYDSELNKKTMYRLKEIPTEITVVKQIFNKYLEFKSLNQVESFALRENIKTCRGNSFDITGLRAILTNMVYVKADKTMFDYCKSLDMDIASSISEFDGIHGLMVYNKTLIRKGRANKLRPTSEWIVAVGKHKGIISSSDFLSVQETIKDNKSKAPRITKNNISILSPLLRCENCKSNLRTIYGSRRKDNTRLHYYKCILKEKSRSKLCNSLNLNGRVADRLVLDEIKNLHFSYNELNSLFKQTREDIIFLNSSNGRNALNIKRDIENYLSQIKKLTRSLSLTTDEKSSKYIIREIEKLDGKIDESNEELDDILKKSNLNKQENLHIEFLENLILDFNSNIDKLKNTEKSYILNVLIDYIVWDQSSLKIFTK